MPVATKEVIIKTAEGVLIDNDQELICISKDHAAMIPLDCFGIPSNVLDPSRPSMY